MKGPLHVIRRRRAERPANGVETAQAATEAPTQAQPTADLASAPAPAAGDQAPPTAEQATTQAPPAEEVPAGQEPIPSGPSFRQRGRLRRRLRYLRRVRELGFRDLGGLLFDQHRFSRVNTALVDSKLAALGAVDAELRALEHALDDRRSLTELREPGISVCSRCGALHGSDARYCPSCGTPVHGARAIAEVGEAVSMAVGEIGAVTPPRPPSTPPPPAQPLTPVPLQVQPLAEPAPAEPAPAQPAAPAAAAPVAPAPTPAAPAPPPAAPPPAPTADGEQPTHVMRPIDEDAAGAAADPDSADEAEAVGQPTGERREP